MTNYERGVEIERKIQDKLEKEGWWTCRTAGSHTKIDIIALKSNEIKLIQSKRFKSSIQSWIIEDALRELSYVKAEGQLQVSKEVWSWLDRKGFTIDKL